ncbi:hypothetical protein C8J57DRAFT_1638868 [Mycena rebaudengoi]|nr:hypothetical protein C8J57DRAFT_1638868 [Mycena rebaudengoi]
MTFVVNGQDEPRVVFNYHDLGAHDRAFNLMDETPFSIAPNSTSEFFNGQRGCTVLVRPEGFTESAVGDISFFLPSVSTGFTTDLSPVFSRTKISPCFSDILYPTEIGGALQAADSSPDGTPTSFRASSCRENCAKPQCDEAAIKHEFNITGNKAPREDVYKYKYLLDVDGNTSLGDSLACFALDHWFSRFARIFLRARIVQSLNATRQLPSTSLTSRAINLRAKTPITSTVEVSARRGWQHRLRRFLRLLRSGSLVFKITAFEEFFNDWLRPFEHYIPVLPDLVGKIEWARSHDAWIQEREPCVS